MLLKINAFLLLLSALFLTACSTVIKPLDTVYWRGKEATEFFARKRMPDTMVKCVKDNEISYIYGYHMSLYELRSYEVGRDATTIYMQTDKVYTGSTWTYLFTDASDKITSVREMSGFGDVEKEFKCDSYQEQPSISEADLKKRKTQPRLWSALYISPAQNLIAGNDNPSRNVDEAKKEALKECTANGGNNCQLLMAYSNMCLSFAQGVKNGQPFDVFGHSLNEPHSVEMALQSCERQGGSSCTVSRTVCALPCDILSDNQCMFDQPQVIVPSVNGGKPVAVPPDSSNDWLKP